MVEPVAQLTFEPAEPTPVIDGVLYQVTGPVPVLSHIQLTDADNRVRGVSPAFTQRNKLGSPGDAEVFRIATTGSPTGGGFTLAVYDQLGHVEHGSTAEIQYDYVDDDVNDALGNLIGEDNVSVTDDLITFGGDLPIKGVTIRVDDTGLTGGTDPHVTISRSTVEAEGRPVEAGGPYYWGPVYIPKDTSIVADLVAIEDDDELSIYEGDSLLDDPVTVYDFGDL